MSETYIPFNYLSILLIVIMSALVGLAPLLIGILIRPRRAYSIKLSSYESGNPPVGEPRYRFSVRFYIIAMLFVVFDIEAVFLYPWAVAYDKIGLYGFVEMMIFIFILLIGYIYAWRKGALEWE